jgi:hypothetical protein
MISWNNHAVTLPINWLWRHFGEGVDGKPSAGRFYILFDASSWRAEAIPIICCRQESNLGKTVHTNLAGVTNARTLRRCGACLPARRARLEIARGWRTETQLQIYGHPGS